jgi:poly(beta-D-mannuronate) lyase
MELKAQGELMMKRLIFWGWVVVLVSFSHSFVWAKSTLRSPWDYKKIKLTNYSYHCPKWKKLSPNAEFHGFYKKNTPFLASIIDIKKMKVYQKCSRPYKRMVAHIITAADAYQQTGSRLAAQCVIQGLQRMANEGIFRGKLSRQGLFVSVWLTNALAIAYLKIRESGLVTPSEYQSITKWMQQIARQTQIYYNARLAKAWKHNLNNLFYWAGLEVASVGIVSNDSKLFQWGMLAYQNGVRQITNQGTLPLEMRRGPRALHYHLFAVAPLVYLAEYGTDNGLNLYKKNHGALHRLVNRVIAGLMNNQYFQKQTGVKQDTPGQFITAGDIEWAVPYVHRFPNPIISRLISRSRSLNYLYLGGLPPA